MANNRYHIKQPELVHFTHTHKANQTTTMTHKFVVALALKI